MRELLQKAKDHGDRSVSATIQNIRTLCYDPTTVAPRWDRTSRPQPLGLQLRPRGTEIHALLLAVAEALTEVDIRSGVLEVYRAIFGDVCLRTIQTRPTEALLGDLRVILYEPPSVRSPRTSGGVPSLLTGPLNSIQARLTSLV